MISVGTLIRDADRNMTEDRMLLEVLAQTMLKVYKGGGGHFVRLFNAHEHLPNSFLLSPFKRFWAFVCPAFIRLLSCLYR